MGKETDKVTAELVSENKKVDQAVAWLQDRKVIMEQELTLFAKEVGDYLLKEFFDDDIDLVSSQNPKKNVSFRILCQRHDLPFSESSLRRFIQVAINFRLLPEMKARKLLPSHHSVLYQVADPEERREIGINAADEGISVRQLRDLVRGKGKRAPGGGRKADSDFTKGWRQLKTLLEDLNDGATTRNIEQLCRVDCSEEEAREVKKLMEALLKKVTRLPKKKS